MSKLKKVLALIVICIIVAIIVIVGLNWYQNRMLSSKKQSAIASEEIVKKGEYLVQVGDCASCHTNTDGAYLAGGYAMSTNFGTLYSSNITPSENYGIGRWTSQDFFKAMTAGIAPPSRNLYPAMPYNYFHGITREDSDAIYSYLMSIPEIDVAVPKDELPFPINQRSVMFGWNMLFFNKTPLPSASTGSSDSWKRGKYLVDTLGHCAMCHSPTGSFGELERDKYLEGGQLGRFQAPPLTPEALSQRGWTQDNLNIFLKKGTSAQGSAYGDMHMVIQNSTQHLVPSDVEAITTYLMGDEPMSPNSAAPVQTGIIGEDQYLMLCSGCHNLDGSGKPNVSVSLNDNSTVRNPDPNNLIAVILDGLPWETFPNGEVYQAMPGFSDDLNDQQVAELVNYLRLKWGGASNSVNGDSVTAIRK